MPPENPGRCGPQGPGGFDVDLLLDGKGAPAGDPAGQGADNDGNGDDEDQRARPEHGNDRKGEDQGREGHEGINHPLDQDVRPSSEVAAHNAKPGPDDGPEKDGRYPDREGAPASPDDPAQDIPAKAVRAEEVVPGRRVKAGSSPRGIGVKGGDQRREDGHQDQRDDECGREGPYGLRFRECGQAPDPRRHSSPSDGQGSMLSHGAQPDQRVPINHNGSSGPARRRSGRSGDWSES